LSTTSVAVVYAVMVETGLNRHDIGKLILSAGFVTDLGTMLALGGFLRYLRVAAAAVRGGPVRVRSHHHRPAALPTVAVDT
jgi:hypothetical protein